jgi:hypothetical protein
VGYPNHRLLLFDGIVVFLKDVVPLFAVVYFTSQKRPPPPPASNRNSFAPSVLSSNNRPYTMIPDIGAEGL